MSTTCSKHCVSSTSVSGIIIHFIVRELLTSQTEWTSCPLGNAISATCLCNFRVLRQVADLYLGNTHLTSHCGQLSFLLSLNLCRWSTLSLRSPAESLADLTGSWAFATVCSLMAGTMQSFVRCAVLPVTAVFSCCSPFRAPSVSCRALPCRTR